MRNFEQRNQNAHGRHWHLLLTPDEAEASVLSALQCGYRLIDTANAYVNEKAVGRAMRKSGIPRDEIFLEANCGPVFMSRKMR